MKLVFSKEIFNWLTDQKILKHPEKQRTPEGYLVAYDDALYFQNGYKIRLILKLLQVEYHLGMHHLPMIRKITVLHEDENWIVIKNTLDKLGVPFSEEEIYSLHQDPSPVVRIVNTLYKDFYMTRKFAKKRIIHPTQKEFSTKMFDYDKDPSRASSSIEFVCLLLTKHFQIKVEEALGMMIDQSSLLARTILLGTSKSGYVRVQNLFDDLLENVDTFSSLLESEPENVKFIMNGFRCGFFGGNHDVAQKTIALVKRAMLKDWLVEIDKGKSVFLGLERHPALSEQFLSLTSSFFGTNIISLIRENFKVGMQKNLNFFMGYAKELISFMRSSLYRKEFIESGILEELLQVVLRALEPESIQTNSRLLALNLLTQLLLTEDFIKNLRYSTTIRRLFQTAQPLLLTLFSKLVLCDNLFKLLQHSIDKHNQTNIRLFYNILCSLMKSSNEDILDFVIENIRVILGKYSTVPISNFLEAVAQLDDLDRHKCILAQIFSDFVGRSLSEQELKLIGEVGLESYQKGLDKRVYGEILVSIIKANYQNSEGLIMMTLHRWLGIYCSQLVKVGFQRIKKKGMNNLNNFPILKPKDLLNLSEVLLPQQQNDLIQLQFVKNTVELLLKLLKMVKQTHHQQIFIMIEEFRKELQGKRGNGKEMEKFMKALAVRHITEEDEQEEEIRAVLEEKKLKEEEGKVEKGVNMDKKWKKLIEVESEERSEGSRDGDIDWEENVEESGVREKGLEDIVSPLRKRGMESRREGSEGVVDSSDDFGDVLERLSINKDIIQRQQQQFDPSHSGSRLSRNDRLPHFKNQEQPSQPSSPIYSIPPLTEQQKFYIHQFSQEQPALSPNIPDNPELEDHQILFIAHLKQIHKLRFQYLMLLVHQQGLDKFSSDYCLPSFFKNNYAQLSQQLLTNNDIEVGEFSDILIMNSLCFPGVNRMGGVLRMIDYFKKQTIKTKGNIVVFDDKERESDLQKVVVEKDGFKQSKLRGIDYVTTIKNRSVDQKYRICYQIMNQLVAKKFSVSSIENMVRITDTVAAEEIPEKKQKSSKVTESIGIGDEKEVKPKPSPNLLDQQRKEKITARIKMLEKQTKSKG